MTVPDRLRPTVQTRPETRFAPEALTAVVTGAFGERYGGTWDPGQAQRESVRAAASGWTPEALHALIAVTRTAADARSAIARDYVSDPAEDESLLFGLLYEEATRLATRVTSLEVSLAWTTILAMAPSDEQFTALWDHSSPIAENTATLRAWMALGVLGPLAWAAGLTPEEIAGQQAAGVLDQAILRSMAALRGWRLPAVTPP